MLMTTGPFFCLDDVSLMTVSHNFFCVTDDCFTQLWIIFLIFLWWCYWWLFHTTLDHLFNFLMMMFLGFLVNVWTLDDDVSILFATFYIICFQFMWLIEWWWCSQQMSQGFMRYSKKLQFKHWKSSWPCLLLYVQAEVV